MFILLTEKQQNIQLTIPIRNTVKQKRKASQGHETGDFEAVANMFHSFLNMDKEPVFQYCIVSLIFIKLIAGTEDSISLAKFTNR